jgi:hypothetical protein
MKTAPELLHDELVAQRAYEIYLQRGGEHGQDVDDWLQAERDLSMIEREAATLTRDLNVPAN